MTYNKQPLLLNPICGRNCRHHFNLLDIECFLSNILKGFFMSKIFHMFYMGELEYQSSNFIYFLFIIISFFHVRWNKADTSAVGLPLLPHSTLLEGVEWIRVECIVSQSVKQTDRRSSLVYIDVIWWKPIWNYNKKKYLNNKNILFFCILWFVCCWCDV